jgi:hypothetical protein
VRSGAVEAVVPLLSLGAALQAQRQRDAAAARDGLYGDPLAAAAAGLDPPSPNPTTTTNPNSSSAALAPPGPGEIGGALLTPADIVRGEGVSATGPGSFEDVEKEACFILGLLAVKPEQQQAIASAGALPGLVRLLRTHKPPLAAPLRPPVGSGGVARRAADAVTNLAHENVEVKHLVRREGGVPPLIHLLSSWDPKVQRAAAGALRTLAFKNEENKGVIVEGGALPPLVRMLRSEDAGVHYEAVGVIGNLVHSSAPIKRRVLDEGALQPVIGLLSSPCPESQREAALLLGQFATADADQKSRIAQRGAVAPLVRMLSAGDTALREMAAFALGRLAQSPDNQAGIVQQGGLGPLLELLDSRHVNLQHNAAFALYGLSDNEDAVPDLIKAGALQRLLDSVDRLAAQASKDCVGKTVTRVEARLAAGVGGGNGAGGSGGPGGGGRALGHAAYMLRSPDPLVRRRTAAALARLAPASELKSLFVDAGGLEILLRVLTTGPPAAASAAGAAAAAAPGGRDGGDGAAGPSAPTVPLCKFPPSMRAAEVARRAAAARGVEQQQEGEGEAKEEEGGAEGGESDGGAVPPAPLIGDPQREAAGALLALARKIEAAGAAAGAASSAGAAAATGGAAGAQAGGQHQQQQPAAADAAPADAAAPPAAADAAAAPNANNNPTLAPPHPSRTVYLGEEYVNSKTLADVTFVVEGKEFYAHRIALLASSDAFRAMFGGAYREREAEAKVEIPNIAYGTFTAMMRYIYTGSCDADLSRSPALAKDLLRAADQYLLDGLKALCESALAGCLTPRALGETFELSEAFSAPQLARRCALFALEQADALLRPPLGSQHKYAELMGRMAPVLRLALAGELEKQQSQRGGNGGAAGAGAGAGAGAAAGGAAGGGTHQ